MKYLLLCLVLLLVPTTQAADTFVHVGMWSQHLDGRQGRNQTHDLLGIEYEDVLFAHFINSKKRHTYAVLNMRRDGVCSKGFCLGHAYGFFKGYRFGDYTGIVPMVLPLLSYNADTWGTDVICVLDKVCSIQFRFRL